MTSLGEALMIILDTLLEDPERLGSNSQVVFDALYEWMEDEIGISPDLALLKALPA